MKAFVERLPAPPRRPRGRQGCGGSRAEVARRHFAHAATASAGGVDEQRTDRRRMDRGDEAEPTPTTFREPLTDVTVTIDSDHLAYVRAGFQIVRDGKTVSHGVDQFTLVREPSGWKFAVIAFTSMPIQ